MADSKAGLRPAVDMSAEVIASRLEELRALYRLAQSLATARKASGLARPVSVGEGLAAEQPGPSEHEKPR